MPTRRAVRPVVLAMVAMLQGLVWAQAADVAAPLRLTGTPALTEKPGNASQGLPVFLFGDRLSGRTDLESVIEGDARLAQHPERGEDLVEMPLIVVMPVRLVPPCCQLGPDGVGNLDIHVRMLAAASTSLSFGCGQVSSVLTAARTGAMVN